MKAFASLHTAKPVHSADAEASYAGYKRVEIDWTPNFGRQAAEVIFPEILEPSDAKAAFIAVSTEESGPGGILQLAELVPNIPLSKPADDAQPYSPRVLFANIPEPLPAGLHPIAAAAWHAVNDRMLDPATLPPKVFEALNKEFEVHGLKVMTCTRHGVGKMVQSASMMKSLDLANK